MAEVVNHTEVFFTPEIRTNIKGVDYYEGHARKFASLRDAISSGAEPIVSMTDAIRVNYMLELVEESARRGAKVSYEPAVIKIGS